MPIYMQYGPIKGNVTAEGHEQWVEVQSLQWGVGRGISAPTGAQKDREASAPSISEIVVTKMMDESTPYFFQEATFGKAKKCVFHLVKTDADTLQTYMEYELEDAMLSGYSVSSGGDRPSESLSVNFTKITMKYVPWNDDAEKGTPIPAGYDMAKAKKV
jgi:type VI secretion system secreted protein Hcp